MKEQGIQTSSRELYTWWCPWFTLLRIWGPQAGLHRDCVWLLTF